MPSVNNTLGVILGGGVGKRLFPLTRERSKPAVPIAGKYRLIDIPISNCVNSGISKIAVLTQFNSVSLHRHITRTYNFDPFHSGWVQIWAAEQTPRSADWYQGTADAVRKQILEIRSAHTDFVLVLAGDHLYRMDYSEIIEYHLEKDADITVAVQPVLKEEAYRFGLLKREKNGLITNFVEKPRDPELQDAFVSRDDPQRPFLGSMGIYLFKTDLLINVLENTTDDDFGGEVIPAAIQEHSVYGFDFDGYWEDIGTIRSFYDTNLRLAQPNSPFNFHIPNEPIYTRARFLPPSQINGAVLENVFLADGCRIERAEIRNSVIGLRSLIGSGVKIADTVLMGADYYIAPEPDPYPDIPIGIGPNCDIQGALIDKNARLGPGVIIRPFPQGTELDTDYYYVRDGIVVIPKNTYLLPGNRIGPKAK